MGIFFFLYLFLDEVFYAVRFSIIKVNWKKYFRKKIRKWYFIGEIYLWIKIFFVRLSINFRLGFILG